MTAYNHFCIYTRCPLEFELTEVSDDALEHYLLEKYIDNSLHRQSSSFSIKSTVRAAYYRLRPLFPVAFRKHLQRFALRGWEKIPFPAWPVDTTVDDLVTDGFLNLLQSSAMEK